MHAASRVCIQLYIQPVMHSSYNRKKVCVCFHDAAIEILQTICRVACSWSMFWDTGTVGVEVILIFCSRSPTKLPIFHMTASENLESTWDNNYQLVWPSIAEDSDQKLKKEHINPMGVPLVYFESRMSLYYSSSCFLSGAGDKISQLSLTTTNSCSKKNEHSPYT